MQFKPYLLPLEWWQVLDVWDAILGSKNLSLVDSPNRANHVEFAWLDNSVRSNSFGLLDNSVQNLSPLLYRQRMVKNKNED